MLNTEEQTTAEPQKAVNYLKMRFLQEVPDFVAVDTKTYGPFTADAVAEIPSENALLLAKNGLAEAFTEKKEDKEEKIEIIIPEKKEITDYFLKFTVNEYKNTENRINKDLKLTQLIEKLIEKYIEDNDILTDYSAEIMFKNLIELDSCFDDEYCKSLLNFMVASKKNVKKEQATFKTEVLTKFAIKKSEEATEMMVKFIEKNNSIYTIRADKEPEVWIYREGIYVPCGKSYIIEFCRDILGEAFTTQRVNNVINKIEADTFIDGKEFFNSSIKDEIVVRNGVLNLKTKELKTFNPKKIFFNKLPVFYNKQADCPNIKLHFINVLKNGEEDLMVIQELVGYTLYKEYFIEKMFMLTGNGRNGKSKTLGLIASFLGPDNVCSVSIDEFENNPYAKGELLNKMVDLAGETGNKPIKDTKTLKELTGRDWIGAQRKFLNNIYFINYAKLINSANELPVPYDKTLAFWDRWIILEFPFTFVNKTKFDEILADVNIKPEEKSIYKLEDPHILDKLTTQEELSGLLNWSLEGLGRLIDNKKFSFSKSSDEVRMFWIRKSDSFLAYMIDNIELSSDSEIVKKDLRVEYIEYCRQNRVRPKSDKNIKDTLYETFGVAEDRVGNDHTWVGIKFKKKLLNDENSEESKDRKASNGISTYI